MSTRRDGIEFRIGAHGVCIDRNLPACSDVHGESELQPHRKLLDAAAGAGTAAARLGRCEPGRLLHGDSRPRSLGARVGCPPCPACILDVRVVFVVVVVFELCPSRS